MSYICSTLFFILTFCINSTLVSRPTVHQSIDVITGELRLAELDLQLEGPLHLTLQRNFLFRERPQHVYENGWEYNFPFCPHEGQSFSDYLLEYDEQGRLSKVQDKKLTKVLLELTHTATDCLVRGYDDQTVIYSYSPYTSSYNHTFQLLKKATLPSGQAWSYQYQEHPSERRMQLVRKESEDGHFLCTEYYSEDDPNCGKVKNQWMPVGNDSLPIKTLHMDYVEGLTEAYDALGNKVTYEYNALGQLTATHFYLKNTQGELIAYRTEKLHWDPKNPIIPPIGKTLEDAEGKVWQYQRFQYNPAGQLIQETLYGNLSGKGVDSFTLDSEGNPTTQVENYTTRYVYEGANLVKVIGDNEISVEYDYQNDLLVGKFYREKSSICLREFYEYNPNGFLIKVITDNGQTTHSTDCAGATERYVTYFQLIASGPAEGLPEIIHECVWDFKLGAEQIQKKQCLLYNSNNRLIQKDHYDGLDNFCFSEKFDYDLAGNLIYFSGLNGEEEEKRYDHYQNLLYERKNEQEIFYNYDYVNRLIEQKSQTETTFFKYDYLGNKLSSKDAYGIEILYEYDSLSRLVRTIYPAVLNHKGEIKNPTLTYHYDLFDRINAITNSLGETTYTTYNVRGKPIRIQYPDRSSECFTYSLDGALLEWTMKNGCKLQYQRDFLYRITSIELYDSIGQLIEKTHVEYNEGYTKTLHLSSGIIKNCVYDYEGKQTSEVTYLGDTFHKAVYHYNLDKSLESIEEWDGDEKHLYTKTVQDQGRHVLIKNEDGTVLQSRSLPETFVQIERKRYVNSLGQNVFYDEELDQGNDRILTYYNALGRVEKRIRQDQNGQILHEQLFDYDLEGHKIWQKETNGIQSQITEWEYGPGGHIIKCIEESGLPSQRITKHVYEQGKLVKTIKPDGVELYTTYNPRGLVEHFYSSDSTLDYSYSYDQNGQIAYVNDHVTKSKTSRKYGLSNQIICEELGNGLSIKRHYDSRGRKTFLELPDGSGIAYVYDALYLRAVQRLKSDKSKVYEHVYAEYDFEGRLLRSELINNLGSIHYDYGEQNQLLKIDSSYFKQAMQFDQFGNTIKTTSNDPLGELTQDFEYDHLNQLVGEESSSHCHRYTFDTFYRCLEKDNDPYHYDGILKLTDVGNSTFEYDQNGNCIKQVKDGKTVIYVYDALDRLIKVIDENAYTVYFQYDCFNRRLKKCVKNYDLETKAWKTVSESAFLYDGEEEIGEIDLDGKILNLRVLGNGYGAEVGAEVAVEIHNQVFVPLSDCRGSVTCLIDAATGNVSESYRYSSFGEETIFDEQGGIVSTSPLGNPWRYSSKRIDDDTGLLFFGQRYYLPYVGRWMTLDPLRADSCNAYAYLNNNPINQVDLYGLFSMRTLYKHMFNGFKAIAFQKISQFTTSFNTMLKQGFKNLIKHSIVEPFFLFTDFYILPSESGIYGRGEASDKVRITHNNGIMNMPKDFPISLRLLAETHGGANIHYIFRPTQGFFSDLVQAFIAKLGYESSHVRQLAAMWKELIEEMGGPEGGGLILHYAHSLGGTDSYTAAQLLTPEERRMIRIYTFGSATMLSDDDFEGVFNFVSKRDGVCLFDIVGYLKGIFSQNSNVSFVGSLKGIPLIDHWLSWKTYTNVIKLLGVKFLQTYPSVD